MLRFICVERDHLGPSGQTLQVPKERIHSTLESAQSDPNAGSILVFDATTISDDAPDSVKVTISDAMNGSPYRTPFAVAAAGGYVVRSTPHGKDLLLIFRREVWDLPKGKVHRGESIPEAALREVREEVGAKDLRIVAPLGTTMHGYPDGKRYAVKTTHWFLMETTSETFKPQAEEQIAAVQWVPWKEAGDLIGFDTLRTHLASIRF